MGGAGTRKAPPEGIGPASDPPARDLVAHIRDVSLEAADAEPARPDDAGPIGSSRARALRSSGVCLGGQFALRSAQGCPSLDGW